MGNPPWFVPSWCGFFILGLLWIVTFYVTQGAYPIPVLQYWNLAVGFALLMAGLRHDDPLAVTASLRESSTRSPQGVVHRVVPSWGQTTTV